MNPESIPGVLPLAEALRTWSDVDLVTAVDVAEATLEPDQCDRFQREWLAEIVQHRRQPKGRPREPYAPQYRALEAAWFRLFAHFSGKVATGELVLWGQMERPMARRGAEPLPALWADELLYYPRRNRIIFRDDMFREVFAAPLNCAGPLQERLQEARSTVGSIPLAMALRDWADLNLLSEVCRCERRYTQHQLTGFPMRPLLSESQDLAKPSDRGWMSGLPDFADLSSAWWSLEDDFRARLVRGEFHLKGVMTKPRREQQVEVLPGVWAADFAFDFRRDTVGFDDTRYVAVTASYARAPQPSAVPDATGDGGDGDPADDELVGATAAPAGPRRGRRGAGPTIEEALRMFWGVLFPHGAPAHPGQATDLASRLIKRVEGSREWRGRKFPEHGTVRRHLPKIYERVLAEKDRPTQSVQ